MPDKPGRTLGLSLAILASVMLFTILPLMQVATVLLLRGRLQAASLPVPGTDATAPIAVGGSYTGIDDPTLLIQALLGVAFLVVAYFAWRGKPSWIRFAMLASVVILTAVTVILSALPLIRPADLSQGLDSGSAFRNVLLSSRLLLSFLVSLYVVWYINRGPARAYYRGYYLSGTPEPPTESL